GAVSVHRARDQLFAGAGLAEHQDVGVRARRLAHELEHLRHRRATPDEILEPEGSLKLLAEVSILELKFALAEAALGGHSQLIHRKVLREVIEGAFLDCSNRGFYGGKRSDED